MTIKLLVLLALGMGNGLLHAFDADHIVAVSSLAANGKRSRRKIMRTALMWSVGHGAILLLIAWLAMGFGVTFPESVFKFAEMAIGVILLVVGGTILLPVFNRRLRITHHRHDDHTAHFHLHDEYHHHGSDHKPVLVGMIHGVAGSAPLLALLPALFQQNYLLALLYILLFSVSVGIAMSVFGGFLGRISRLFGDKLDRGYHYIHKLLGVQATVFGVYWLYLSA